MDQRRLLKLQQRLRGSNRLPDAASLATSAKVTKPSPKPNLSFTNVFETSDSTLDVTIGSNTTIARNTTVDPQYEAALPSKLLSNASPAPSAGALPPDSPPDSPPVLATNSSPPYIDPDFNILLTPPTETTYNSTTYNSTTYNSTTHNSTTHNTPANPPVENNQLTSFNFNHYSLNQLNSSIVSITTIDLLTSIFKNIFHSNLIPKATDEFNNTRRHSTLLQKLLLKLDVKIFSDFISKVILSANFLLDLNLSNNLIVKKIKLLHKTKEYLNNAIWEKRSLLNQLKFTYFQLSTKNHDPTHLLQLNQSIKHLNHSILNPSDPSNQIPPQHHPRSSTALINLINPNNGLLQKIKNLNIQLKKNLQNIS
ncbi:hypothetical protein TBLA_0A09900 [Henningerozyma blattae CBS 6284]|uniref:Inner kinetochore subunit AME1 domain-containing protein n=1 Tax=Henningerozyma blattae (strain ATCC 34711 / CBS 6284 / DSM 70876 / NBRC 10599 / NRRL Y-10934 / UCD 77-7) TaxID=1071380 RepID=I2GXC1_HENB6|nr:hypothetical protein TBLA_0A09900 [Tetrapisispora blattae CBS 6284]CCH58773.1 hypothetical protein TBLA_0A09900 [Tetrapisispora blattae CBS 6284]